MLWWYKKSVKRAAFQKKIIFALSFFFSTVRKKRFRKYNRGITIILKKAHIVGGIRKRIRFKWHDETKEANLFRLNQNVLRLITWLNSLSFAHDNTTWNTLISDFNEIIRENISQKNLSLQLFWPAYLYRMTLTRCQLSNSVYIWKLNPILFENIFPFADLKTCLKKKNWNCGILIKKIALYISWVVCDRETGSKEERKKGSPLKPCIRNIWFYIRKELKVRLYPQLVLTYSLLFIFFNSRHCEK